MLKRNPTIGVSNMTDVEDKVIRTFSTGATRDTATGKLDYEGFESPIVFKSYAQYLNKHRKTADGSFRDSDNWQNLFGEKHYDVCMKSMLRHVVDAWLQHRGFQPEQSMEDDLNAIIFNAKAYLFKLLTEKKQ